MEDRFQCTICLEVAYRPVTTPCGHLYCWECINNWMSSNQQANRCPNCKAGISKDSLIPLNINQQERPNANENPGQSQSGPNNSYPQPNSQFSFPINSGLNFVANSSNPTNDFLSKLMIIAGLLIACLGCTNLILDGGELAIHREVGIPRGRIYAESLKFLSKNEVQLLHAAGSSNLSSLRYYLSQGVNPNTYDENRTSPLHVAARQGSQQVLSELIQKGASINLTDVAGWSPLHVGAYYGRSTAVSLLLDNGADSTLINRRGETPWDLASNESTQQLFAQHCRESELGNRRPTMPLDLSSMEFAALLQNARPDHSADRSPLFEESQFSAELWIHPGDRRSNVFCKVSPRVAAECIKLFNREPLRGLSVMIILGVCPPETHRVARFLVGEKRLKKQAIGAVLGECEPWYKEVGVEFMKLVDFSHLNIVAALKKTMNHVELPTEGASLNQVLQAFGAAYALQNANFGSCESVQSLAFSILMLNKENPVSKSKFIRANKGLREGQDFPEGILGWIYDETRRDTLTTEEKTVHSPEPFTEMDRREVIVMKGKEKNIGLLEQVLFFFPQASNTPYALLVLSNVDVSEHWLTGTISIKKEGGIPTAKITKDGKVKTKYEPVIQFKSESLKPWLVALNHCTTN